MRILFCNKYNYPFSGTEVYMFEAMELLRSRGLDVALFSMSNTRGKPSAYDRHFLPYLDFKRQSGRFHVMQLAERAIYSREARRRIRAMIAEFRPDVAHVRNIYHHLSPSILWELKAQKVPVVYHLNDFKVLCPSYNFVSHGEACEACKGGAFWRTLKEKCYPGWGARMALIAEAYTHRQLGTYEKCVDRFLAPSQFVRDKFVEHGWDSSKFQVLPHFQRLRPIAGMIGENAPLLYFGRLSPEKGVADLLHAMRRLPNLHLVVAGDGPQRTKLQQLATDLKLDNVRFAGHVRGADLDALIANSSFTLLPSHAYETFGKTILESYAAGRAVVATDLGSRRELVSPGITGLLYQAGDIERLVSAIRFLSSRPELAETMGQAGRQLLRENHTPEAHYDGLIGMYEQLIHDKKQATSAERRESLPENFAATAVRASTNGAGFVPLQRLSSAVHSPLDVAVQKAPVQRPQLRVAFIGGRGVVSKYSGIETYYEEIGKNLAQMGHHVTAYCRSYFTPPLTDHNGIHVMRLPTIRSKHLETLVHTFLSTLHVLIQPCDVVHYHALGPALFSFIPRLAGKKTVVTVQGLDWQRRKWGWIASHILRLGERAAVTFPNKTMVVSRTLQGNYRDAYGSQPSYIPNGGVLRERRMPDQIFDWDLEPDKYVLFLGRFSPEKGCHLLIEAYEQLDTDIKLVMAGASSYCDDYFCRLRAHASDRIRILDWVTGDNLHELLTNAMVFVLPSDLEGLSLALLDAMGAGLCVLASDIAENREAIENAGFTFRHGDAADLADRLSFLIANPAVREAAGREAKRRITENYQWPKIAAEIEGVYFTIMDCEFAAPAAKKPSGRVSVVPSETSASEKQCGTG